MKHPFHEWPLVVFSALAILGAGLLMMPLVSLLFAGRPDTPADARLVGLALLAAGAVVSLAHLGQPLRAPLALARLGRSRLSLEIALAAATLAAAAASLIFAQALTPALLSSAFACAFLVSLGFVYALPGQLTWRGAVVLTPLTSGVAFGALAFAATMRGRGVVLPLVPLLLAPDAVVFLRWCRGVMVNQPSGAWAHRVLLLGARFALVDVLPWCLLLADLPRSAAGSAGLGIVVGRLGFYLLAVQQTTDSEVRRVERMMGGTI